jgi:hypothetical protein
VLEGATFKPSCVCGVFCHGAKATVWKHFCTVIRLCVGALDFIYQLTNKKTGLQSGERFRVTLPATGNEVILCAAAAAAAAMCEAVESVLVC